MYIVGSWFSIELYVDFWSTSQNLDQRNISYEELELDVLQEAEAVYQRRYTWKIFKSNYKTLSKRKKSILAELSPILLEAFKPHIDKQENST
jgi:diphthamide biosynthesis methyltransferase